MPSRTSYRHNRNFHVVETSVDRKEFSAQGRTSLKLRGVSLKREKSGVGLKREKSGVSLKREASTCF